MNFAEAQSYLYSLGNEILTMKLGLENIRTLARAFDDPHLKFPAVHIAGTNGKGSTAAMTAEILQAADLRVGLYTSPHLISITERIKVGGDDISPEYFARIASDVRTMGERLVAEGELEGIPTFFEQMTMIAFVYFAEAGVDVAVLEVGLGGRFDATNICSPAVTAITPVGYDHEKYLGDTLFEIAGEKAGIIKMGIPVVVAPQNPDAMQAIEARANELNAPIILVDDTDHYHFNLKLRGKHQVLNALTAIKIVEQLLARGWDISKETIERGLNNTRWPGRLELIRPYDNSAPILLDGAHNIAGAGTLRDYLDENYSSTRITMIFGAMNDKPIDKMAGILFSPADNVIAVKIDNARAAEPEKIALIAESMGKNAICVGDAETALEEALRVTTADGLICVCGSLYLVGEIRGLIDRRLSFISRV